MTMIDCIRCARQGSQMGFQPFQNDLGKRAYEQVCTACWSEWLQHQTALINHYGLNLRDAKAKEFLFEQMEQYLFNSEPRP